jgi:hypothetical protein
MDAHGILDWASSDAAVSSSVCAIGFHHLITGLKIVLTQIEFIIIISYISTSAHLFFGSCHLLVARGLLQDQNKANNPATTTKSPLYEALAGIPAALVTCTGSEDVVLLPVAPADVALPETPGTTVGFAEPALVAWLTAPAGLEAGFDAPAAEDTAAGEEAIGTTETVSTEGGRDEVPAFTEEAETGTGTMGEAVFAGELAALEPASETGQTVVYKAIVDVRTWVDCAGQFVTVAAHEVTVMRVVE